MEVSQITSSGAVAALQIKTKPGALYSLVGFNSAAADQYIQLYDKASTPGVGDKPVVVIKATAGNAFYVDFMRIPRRFLLGIFVGNSSTATSYTAGAADCIFDAMYV